MASPSTMKRSPLTPSTITPPSLNRQNSYTARPDGSHTSYASMALANLRSRSMSPARSGTTASSHPRIPGTGLSTPPLESSSSSPTQDRRTSWEDCVHQREGYISFPDFDDQLRAQREQFVGRQ
ncbi:hypothetical protein KC343_g4715 [Hortaea werneckii]|uniref:Uncharacterized protein n=1 Tax=Hortaea werneckii TaxID=91943 RepID=A0A3M7E1W0_HORWE|nr:hypothetical protein KC323_g7099 [Hortaea werneckii]KAI6859161.1 hypothetical protein KC338_g7394 [Hortaea werneckii]KAI7347457.1 hypothetical protein KC320_g7211 [Hortaea werneckii]KAI7630294.1 hypothetical protein KC343_g4715 [Hortaea werneckii]KAI7649086.1 hypothetical protein KC319_g11299 [Hortaea werneckii]